LLILIRLTIRCRRRPRPDRNTNGDVVQDERSPFRSRWLRRPSRYSG
jgi:hypothetical protein